MPADERRVPPRYNYKGVLMSAASPGYYRRLADDLVHEDGYGAMTAHDYDGRIWYDRAAREWCAEVRVGGAYQATLSAASPGELRARLVARFGDR